MKKFEVRPMRILDRLDTRKVHADRTTLPKGWMKLYKALQERVHNKKP